MIKLLARILAMEYESNSKTFDWYTWAGFYLMVSGLLLVVVSPLWYYLFIAIGLDPSPQRSMADRATSRMSSGAIAVLVYVFVYALLIGRRKMLKERALLEIQNIGMIKIRRYYYWSLFLVWAGIMTVALSIALR